MSKKMQNLVVFIEPTKAAWETPLKAGTMILNRFCIDEDAAFELSGVNYLEKSSAYLESVDHHFSRKSVNPEIKLKRKEKGKEYSF